MSTSSGFDLQFRQSDRYRVPIERRSGAAVNGTESPIGMLNFIDGTPTEDTVRRLKDNLDRTRSLEVFLKNYSGVSLYRLWRAQHRRGLDSDQVRLHHGAFPPQLLLPRASRFEGWCCIDLEKEGATIIDLPTDVLGIAVDMWFRLIGDLGPAALDGQRGGKYLILPPRLQFKAPQECRILYPKTNRVWLFLRTLRAQRDTDFTSVVKALTIRSLAVEHGLRPIKMVDASKLRVKGGAPNDDSFFEDLDRLIQREPFGAHDRESHNLLASIGMAKGKPFRPSARMKRVFRDAAVIGSATIRATMPNKAARRGSFRTLNGSSHVLPPHRK